MKRFMFAAFALTALSLGACGKDSPGHEAKAKSLADRACACKGDAKCLEKVEADWEKWETEARKGARPSAEVMSGIQMEEARMEKCAEGE